MIDKLEYRDADAGSQGVLDADAWVGTDLNKFWFKTEVERAKGEYEEAETTVVFSNTGGVPCSRQRM